MCARYYENGYCREPFQESMASRPAMTIEDVIRRKICALRHWKKTNLYKRHPNWKFQFSVMTYNILSQIALENHGYLYRNCNPLFLKEDYRVAMIVPEILNSRSDIVCLQEVEEFVYETRMKKYLESKGFLSIFKRRTCNRTDGCAIFWRRTKFLLVGQNDIEFRTRDNKVLDRDNIGLIAVLRPNHRNAGNTLLHVATTHLLYNPRRGDVKLCQLRWLLAELDRMALIEVKDDARHYHPVILCGDLNIQPHSPLYQFIETGHINVANTMSGDLSGQSRNSNSGKLVRYENLMLDNIGISRASRFEDEPLQQQSPLIPLNIETNPIANTGEPKSYTSSDNIVASHTSMNPLSSTNIAPDNSSVTNSSNGCTESQPNEWFSHDFKFVPVYKFHTMDKNSLPVTSIAGSDCHTVDHIFYGVKSKTDCQSYREGALKLLSLYTLLKKEDLFEIGGLPNAALGSDHICLAANFALDL